VLGSLTAVKDSDTTARHRRPAHLDLHGGGFRRRVLAKDQTKVESFTITLDDGNGGLITKQIDVTITGTNDAPVITAQDLTGAVTEQVTPAGNLSDSGTISFSDVDLTTCIWFRPPAPDRLRARLAHRGQGQRHHGTAPPAAAHLDLHVADSAVEYLAKDQPRSRASPHPRHGNGGLINQSRSTSPSPAPMMRP